MSNLFGFTLFSILMMSCSLDEATNTPINNMNIDKMEENDSLLIDLKDSNEQVRSAAASKLVELEHPYALQACIETIDDAPDKLHLDYTPSVHSLIKMGLEALPLTAELLLSENELTRLRAQRVIERVTSEHWKTHNPEDERQALEDWRTWWDSINLDYKNDSEDRKDSVTKLKDWISSGHKVS